MMSTSSGIVMLEAEDSFTSTPSIGLLAMQCSVPELSFVPEEEGEGESDLPVDSSLSNLNASLSMSLVFPQAPLVTPPGSPDLSIDPMTLSPRQRKRSSPKKQQQQQRQQPVPRSPSPITTGEIQFEDGRCFRGKHLGTRLIHGRMTYKDGTIYEGGWVDGQRQGRGVCQFPDGSQYEGDCVEGHFHGEGCLVWADGGFYMGEWSAGEMDGRGMEVRADGTLRHDGLWRNGVPLRKEASQRSRQVMEPRKRHVRPTVSSMSFGLPSKTNSGGIVRTSSGDNGDVGPPVSSIIVCSPSRSQRKRSSNASGVHPMELLKV